MLELPNDQPHQSPKQSYADHTEQMEATSGEDHRWRTGRLQNRKEHQRADLQPTNPLWEISPAPATPLSCLHRLQESLWRVWHAALWATTKKYNISTNLIWAIENLYDKATSAILFNSIGNWLRTTAGVWQGCLLSPTLFNIFLERIMTDPLEASIHAGDHGGSNPSSPMKDSNCLLCHFLSFKGLHWSGDSPWPCIFWQ